MGHRFCEDIGVAKIGIEDMCFISNSDYCVNKKDEANAIVKAWQYGQKKGVKVIGSWAGFRKNNYFSFKQPLYCPGNGGEICVNTNGTIYPCYGIQIPIGNIYDLNKIFQNNLYKAMAQRVAGNIKECSGCPLEGPCSGGCVGDILNKTNSLTKVYKEKCNFQKKITFHILKKYFALN